MKVILIQGRVNAGKTTLCNKIKETFTQKSNEDETIHFFSGEDFCHKFIIDGKTIIVVSAGDDDVILDRLEDILKNNPNCDIFISVIRPSERIKNKRLHNRTKGIFISGGVKPEDITIIDLDKLTKVFIEDKVFNNEFMSIFNSLIK